MAAPGPGAGPAVREEYERALALAQLGWSSPRPSHLADHGYQRQDQLPGHAADQSLAQPSWSADTACAPLPLGPCAYANICEHWPNFRNDPSFLPILAAQPANACARGWGSEAARHRNSPNGSTCSSPGPHHDQ